MTGVGQMTRAATECTKILSFSMTKVSVPKGISARADLLFQMMWADCPLTESCFISNLEPVGINWNISAKNPPDLFQSC
jgi:hypothetical protein